MTESLNRTQIRKFVRVLQQQGMYRAAFLEMMGKIWNEVVDEEKE